MSEVKGSYLVCVFLNRGKQFVTQAQVQSQLGRDLPIILHIKRVDRAVIVDVVQVIDAAAIGKPYQERSEARAAMTQCGRSIGKTAADIHVSTRRSELSRGQTFA